MSMWTWMKGGETEDSKTVPNWTLAESLPLNMMCVPTETDGNWVDEGEVSGMSQTGGEPGEGGAPRKRRRKRKKGSGCKGQSRKKRC